MIDENLLRSKRISVLFGLCFGLILGWFRGGTHPGPESQSFQETVTGQTERGPAGSAPTTAISAGGQGAQGNQSPATAHPPSGDGGPLASLPPTAREALKELDLVAVYQKYRAYFPAGPVGDAAATVTVLREEMTRGPQDPIGQAARAELERLRANPELAFQVVQDGMTRIPHGRELTQENDTRHFWLQFAAHLGADSGKVSDWLEGQTRERAVPGDTRGPSVAFEALLQMHGADRGRIDGIFEEAMRSQERSEDAQRALIFAYARVDVAKAEQLDRQLASGSRRRRR